MLAGGQSAKSLSPVDTRALSWLAFARGCLDAQRHAASKPGLWDSTAFAAAAWALAQQPPFVASWRTLSVQVRLSGRIWPSHFSRFDLSIVLCGNTPRLRYSTS